jgi:hypothetical protein
MSLAGKWFATVEDALVTHCPDCGGNRVGFHNMPGITRAIATAMVAKPSQLAAEEIKFLRTHLGYSDAKLCQGRGRNSLDPYRGGTRLRVRMRDGRWQEAV